MSRSKEVFSSEGGDFSGKKSSSEFYFLRHGKARNNIEGRASAWPETDPYELVELGVDQARAAAERIKEMGGADIIFSSDLTRTKQTADVIGRELDIKVITDPRLRDIDVGVWNNKTLNEMHEVWPVEVQWENKAEGGESGKDVLARVLEFMNEASAKHPGKKIVVVTHADPIRFVGRHFGAEVDPQYATPVKIDFGAS